jgi:hypothetical protein
MVIPHYTLGGIRLFVFGGYGRFGVASLVFWLELLFAFLCLELHVFYIGLELSEYEFAFSRADEKSICQMRLIVHCCLSECYIHLSRSEA